MLGKIKSYDSRRRCGFIQSDFQNEPYYFSSTSVSDKDLIIATDVTVQFEPYHHGERTVAIRIRKPDQVELCEKPVVSGVVKWYNSEKRYGFIACNIDPPIDAFLHQNELLKVGTEHVKSGQKLWFKLNYNKRKPIACDVMFLPPKSASGQEECTGRPNALPAPSNLKNQNHHSIQDKNQSKHHFNGHYSSHEHSRDHTSFAPHDRHTAKPSSSQKNPEHSDHRYLYAQAQRGLQNMARMVKNEQPETQSLDEKMSKLNIKNAGYPLKNITMQSSKSPSVTKPTQQNSRLVQSTLKQHFTPTKKQEQAPTKLTKEQEKVQEQILQNQKLLRCLDLSKLPDRGQRLKDQIAKLEIELTEMKLRKPAEEIGMIKNRPPPVIQRPSEHRGPILIDLTDDTSLSRNAFNETNPRNHADNYYGGRMTVNRLNVVTKVTTEAIEILHSSLETCPPSSNEESDPEGLKVELMAHQRQALAWMIWREKQSVSGGILADDMGLGKTLTMISLILKQLQIADGLKKMVKNEPTPEASTENVKTEIKKENASTNNRQKVGKVKSELKEEVTSKYFKAKEETKDPDSDNGSEEESENLFPSDSTVIIAPASLIFHWRNEIKNRCDKGLLSIHLYHGKDRERDAEKLAEFDVVITTYDIVRRTHPKAEKDKDGSINDKSSNSLEHALFLIKWRRVILDEAHQIRNHKSQTSIAACALHAHSRWAMSGTPVQNQEADMYAMIRFLHCSPFDEHKLWKNQVNNNTERGQQRLRTLVSCLVLRREKNQRGANGRPLVNLPSRTFKLHKLKLNPIEREVYDKLKTDSQAAYKNYEREKRNPSGCQVYNPEESKKMTATTLLVMLLRLRQCCGHLHLLQGSFDPELLLKEKEDIAVEDLFQSMNIGAESAYSSSKYSDKSKAKYFEISEPSSKISFVMDTLHKLNFEQPEDKSVVISQWTSMLKILTHHLRAAKFSYAIIDGSVSAAKRMELVDDFNKNPIKPKIMLVSLQAGGVGLNLIGGNHLFLLDMHWNPALEKQAFDRIYRVGQKKEVFVHKFIMEDTVEQQILQLQERKLSIAKAVMEGADVDNKVKLTLADMKMLFGI